MFEAGWNTFSPISNFKTFYIEFVHILTHLHEYPLSLFHVSTQADTPLYSFCHLFDCYIYNLLSDELNGTYII